MEQSKLRRKTLLDEIAEDMGERIAPAQPSPLPVPIANPPAEAEERPSLRAELLQLQKRLQSLFKFEQKTRKKKGGAAIEELRQKALSLSAEIDRLERAGSELRLSLHLAEEEKARLEKRREELREHTASLREAHSRRARELAALREETKSLESAYSRLQKKLEETSERAFDLEGRKSGLERKLREVDALIAEENKKLAGLRAQEAELKRLINLGWEVVGEQDEERKKLEESLRRLEKEKAARQLHSGGAGVAVEKEAGKTAREKESGVTDADTLHFLASVKYSERFTPEEEAALSSQGFVRMSPAASLTQGLLRKLLGGRSLEFFVLPRSQDAEKDFACWLLTLLLADEARDVVSNGGAFDVSFLSPASGSEPDARYAIEVSLRPPSGDELLSRLKKLSWAKDYLILASDEAAEAWRKNLNDPTRIITAGEVERSDIASLLSCLKGFASEEAKSERLTPANTF